MGSTSRHVGTSSADLIATAPNSARRTFPRPSPGPRQTATTPLPAFFDGLLVKLVDLDDGVLRAASRPVPVTGRVEPGREDRFQDQLQRHLHPPVTQGRDPQTAGLARLLGDRDLSDRWRFHSAPP